MQLGMIGLGRMGGSMVRRLLRGGHSASSTTSTRGDGAAGRRRGGGLELRWPTSWRGCQTPRAIWLMVPAAVVDRTVDSLAAAAAAGDAGDRRRSTPNYTDDIRPRPRAGRDGHRVSRRRRQRRRLGWRSAGYCLMIGGRPRRWRASEPVFKTLGAGPGGGAADGRPAASASTADQGYLHCGPTGAGHFVKMVHNGIEYGLMAAYAEGFNILAHAGIGTHRRPDDAETAPLREPAHYPYEIPLPESGELWRRGSVVGSWLLDLTARAGRASGTCSRLPGACPTPARGGGR
jgi:6-phosphogluconate dehydrogenase